MVLPWMLGESWSRRESLKVSRCGGVGDEGLMHFLLTISNSIFPLILFLLLLLVALKH